MKKEITMIEYEKLMDKVIAEHLSMDETFTKMMEIAGKYDIKEGSRGAVCTKCGKQMKPAKECKKQDGFWDGHTFKCKCMPKIYVSIG